MLVERHWFRARLALAFMVASDVRHLSMVWQTECSADNVLGSHQPSD